GRRSSGDVTSRWQFAAVTSMYAWSVSWLRRCLRKDSAPQLHSPRWVGCRLARPQFGHLRVVQRPLLPARLPRRAQWAVQRPLLPARLPRRAQWLRCLRLPWWFLKRCQNERLGQKLAGNCRVQNLLSCFGQSTDDSLLSETAGHLVSPRAAHTNCA